MQLTRIPLAVFVSVLIFGLSPDSTGHGVLAVDDNNAVLDEVVESSIFGEALAMSDATLSEMRGGFTTTSGLQIAFGIERAVYVNGALISTTSISVLNLGNLTPNVPTAADITAGVNVPTAADITAGVNVPTAADITASVNVPTAAELSAPVIAALPQINVGTPVAGGSVPSTAASPSATSASAAPVSNAVSTPASSSASAAVAPVVTPAISAGVASTSSSNATSSIQTPSVTTTPGSVALIQTGGGNIVVPAAFSASSAGTVVQNSLNDQKIQSLTVVNATVNSMQILKELNLQAAISSAINDSVRK